MKDGIENEQQIRDRSRLVGGGTRQRSANVFSGQLGFARRRKNALQHGEKFYVLEYDMYIINRLNLVRSLQSICVSANHETCTTESFGLSEHVEISGVLLLICWNNVHFESLSNGHWNTEQSKWRESGVHP